MIGVCSSGAGFARYLSIAAAVVIGLSPPERILSRHLPVLPLSAAATVAPPHPEAAPPGHTGGFGEPSCHSCHFDGPLNDEEGTLSLKGLPEGADAAGSYTVELRLVRPDMQRAGFQLTARFADGTQAGSFELLDERAQVIPADTSGILYLTHTAAGTSVTEPGFASWLVRWCLPERGGGPVLFHAAANAANDDQSEFGDSIYLLERRTR